MARPEPHSSALSRVALGTAQLGMNYGIANHSGQPDQNQAQALLKLAVSQGLNWFDTAAAYGNSEAVLGKSFAELGLIETIKVASKGTCRKELNASLSEQVSSSLQRLQLPRLEVWLLHDEAQLTFWDRANADEADNLSAQNKVGAWGISVYHPDFALRAIEERGLQCVQFPANPFDRRFLSKEMTTRFLQAGSCLFIRSIYLQGLCLMAPEQVPAHIFRAREAISTLASFCQTHGFARDYFCLHYVLHRSASTGARLVLGMETPEQLLRNLELLAAPPPTPECLAEWDACWPEDLDQLILPYLWKTTR